MLIESWLTQLTENVTLGTQAEKVLRDLSRAPQLASYASAREVAERAGVNVSTVIRTAQQLGFDGWPDLRQTLRSAYLRSVESGDSAPLTSSNAAAQMLSRDSSNVSLVATEENIRQIRAVAEAISTSRRTVVLATGTGSGPALILSYMAAIHGHDIHLATGAATMQAMDVAQLGPEDFLLVINVWRLTRVLRGLTRQGRRQGATVAVLTDLRSSPLNADADHTILIPIEGVDSAPSLTATVAVVHAILAELTDRNGGGRRGATEQLWNELDLMDDQA